VLVSVLPLLFLLVVLQLGVQCKREVLQLRLECSHAA
jgi:hypothetical protein